ncbi:disease resistance protein RGH3, partial [Striga asiatica]
MGKKAIEAARVFVEETGISDSLSAEEFLVEREDMLQSLFPSCQLMPGASRLINSAPPCKWILGDDPEVKQGKPSPDVFIAAAKRFEGGPVDPQKILVFEDAPSGVLAAKNVGMSVVMVGDPRLDNSYHQTAGKVISSLLDFNPSEWGLPRLPGIVDNKFTNHRPHAAKPIPYPLYRTTKTDLKTTTKIRRGWSTISQEYNSKRILLEVLHCIGCTGSEDSEYEELGKELYQSLFGRRYLIVMDDIWGTDAWEEVKRFFPNNNNEGSRVLITTRSSKVAWELDGQDYFQMPFLNLDESWNLLQRCVFGEEQQGCSPPPPELEEIGKNIASNCRGLPLSIVVIGGLLAKSGENWQHVLENLSSTVNLEEDERCFRILRLSYDQLPVHLKPCFLYMGMFREDESINVPRLMSLWVDEGFVKPVAGKSLETIARLVYFNDLVLRNLIIVRVRGNKRLNRENHIRATDEDIKLFYYFVESESKPEEAPLMLWLTGCSGLLGFVYQIGPFTIGISNSNESIPPLTLNDFYWTKVADIIFVDQPAGSEFSYAKNSAAYYSNDTLSAKLIYIFLRKSLFGRRYLIVMDDIWGTDAWDEMKRFFPNNNDGSRVLITTRPSKVALQLDGPDYFQMPFLNLDESWNLLQRCVFGEEQHPELEEIGKNIARNCRGLPLSIVVIGGLLAKSEQTQENWQHVLENLSSTVNLEEDERCLRILKLSYNQLPVHLKPCFLYMGIFREDEPIQVSTLIRLWVDEGFVKPAVAGKSLETIARLVYFDDLVLRNLIMVRVRGSNGRIK